WTFWRVHSDDSYVIRNYTTGRFLGLLYHGKLAGVDEGAAIHWDIHPSGYDASTWIIRMKHDTLSMERVLTLTKTNGDVILDFADDRLSGLQEWRFREAGMLSCMCMRMLIERELLEYLWPSDDPYMPEFAIDEAPGF
ncbi:hypothetical protein H0H87_003468, partial [Tephrocybe sp. NHM501043]